MMPSVAYSPEFGSMPGSICWLCRRESEIFRFNHAPNRPARFRVITFSQDAAGRGGPARISPVFSTPRPVLPRHAWRTKSSSYRGKTDHDVVSYPIYNAATQTWVFQVHADCWDLVACRVSDPVACATTWCRALASLNWNLPSLQSWPAAPEAPRLLVADTTPGRKNYRRPSLQRLENFDGLAAELGLERLPTVHEPVSLERLGLYTSNLDFAPRCGKGIDAFSALPDEILLQIVRFTPTADLLSLRLASRSVANVSRLPALPRSFWLSRFLPPFEMGFALPERYDRDWDWRALYFMIRRALLRGTVSFPRAHSLLARLAKRSYWWERLRDIPELYSVWGAGRVLEGIPSGRPMRLIHRQSPSREGRVVCAVAQLRRDDGAERCHSTVCVPLPARPGVLSAVGVSTVEIGGSRHVSGLRFFHRGLGEPERLGYVLEHAETILRLDQMETLLGLMVRWDTDAIKSLGIILSGPSGELRVSQWIGDVEAPSGSETATQTTVLVRELGETSFRLVASFDVSAGIHFVAR